MSRYVDAAQAEADGFRIVHEPELSRFAILREGPVDAPAGDAAVGVAHYTLLGDDVIDFDHTVVDPSLRGTGLSGLLAHHALRRDVDDVIGERKVRASCWFIAHYLTDHPEVIVR